MRTELDYITIPRVPSVSQNSLKKNLILIYKHESRVIIEEQLHVLYPNDNQQKFYHTGQPHLPLQLSHWLRAVEYMGCYPRVGNLGY